MAVPFVDIAGCIPRDELEDSRKERIKCGNVALSQLHAVSHLQVAPVSANGECFVRSVAVEMQQEEFLMECRILYVYMLECLIKQGADMRNFLVDDDGIFRERLRAIREVHEYAGILQPMTLEIYCLDKLEGLTACEHGLLDRNYCDYLGI